MHSDRDMLAAAEAAAREAGALLRGLAQWEMRAAVDKDVKLDADVAAEDLIAEHLAHLYPVLAEERGGSLSDGPTWIVDPLDGTVNFSRRIPLSCVSIALWHAGPILGVVYDFVRDEMFSGVVGEGCRVNQVPVSASAVSSPDRAILLTGLPVGGSFDPDDLSRLVQQFQVFQKVRLLGSAALSLAYVASGRADVYHERGIRIWDVAAGLALVAAAGGNHIISGDDFHTVTATAPLLNSENLFN